MQSHGPFSRNGWTLLELTVVLALAGLLTTLAVPSFASVTGRVKLRAASQELMQTLRTARQRAMIEGRASTVHFDSAGRDYVGDGRGLPVPLPAGVRFGSADGVLGPPSQPTQSPPAAGVSFRNSRVTFLPDGTLSPGPGTIYLHGGRATLAISLSMAGHVRRYRWEGGQWTAW